MSKGRFSGRLAIVGVLAVARDSEIGSIFCHSRGGGEGRFDGSSARTAGPCAALSEGRVLPAPIHKGPRAAGGGAAESAPWAQMPSPTRRIPSTTASGRRQRRTISRRNSEVSLGRSE